MPTTHKYKVLVVIKVNGSSQTIYPIIEASSEHEARVIAKAQYPQGDVRSVSQIR